MMNNRRARAKDVHKFTANCDSKFNDTFSSFSVSDNQAIMAWLRL